MPETAPYIWTAAKLDADRSWQINLPPGVLDELEALLPQLQGRALEDLTATDCPVRICPRLDSGTRKSTFRLDRSSRLTRSAPSLT